MIRRACLVTRQRIMVTSPKMRGSVSRQLVSTRTTAECSRAGDLRRVLSICPTDRQTAARRVKCAAVIPENTADRPTDGRHDDRLDLA